ncbi:Biotin/lipoate A/B protein ligase-like protein [Elsinoe fawcettii]|nr:Biotin/lipoate A/B protein ligase-like protein [Elsinoe fawcettii]
MNIERHAHVCQQSGSGVMILRHIHLTGLIPYRHASALQDRLVASFLAYKKSPTTLPALTPAIITCQFHPVYTCGRREIGTVSAEQQTYLRAGGADFHEALRGGQTTFHGPGQVIAYPVIDLKRHGLIARSYVCLLEKSLIRTCARYGVKTMTTEHPGVWVSEEEKIAALGIHLRRNVSSHGIGLNVNTDLEWFKRIVACGLEGKRTTSLLEQGVTAGVDEVANVFVEEFANGLDGVDAIQHMTEQELD